MYIHHITLNTGHSRNSPREEVGPLGLEAGRALLDAAIAGDKPPIPRMPAYHLGAITQGRCVIIMVWAGSRCLMSIGIAQHSRCGSQLWRAMHDHSNQPLATGRDSVPPEPWLAVRLEDVGPADYQHLAAFADLQRCLAWAWLDRLGK